MNKKQLMVGCAISVLLLTGCASLQTNKNEDASGFGEFIRRSFEKINETKS